MPKSTLLNNKQMINPITPTADFFIITRYQGPPIDVDKWRLSLDGSISNPLSLSYETLTTSYSRVSEVMTMECVINPVGGRLVGTAVWSGAPLQELMNEVDVHDTTIELFCTSSDGLNRGLPLTYFNHPLTLLAYEMNGQRLQQNYGFPVRLVVPGYYGFVWRKWLLKLTFTVDPYTDSQWLKSMKAIKSKKVQLSTKILVPQDQEKIQTAPHTIIGASWGSGTPIHRVEVSLDEGRSWTNAEILWSTSHPYAWVIWKLIWEPQKNCTYTVTARAIDTSGRTQLNGVAPYPSGFGSWHRIQIQT
ncbi:MAG: molybdopterin-dependent oxidoreductase [Candidatus Bathyarchaeota archaeon]|nr:molybdopterin-dependent oxidoreductase [Candidatus Bathyarchaeota archaeon]